MRWLSGWKSAGGWESCRKIAGAAETCSSNRGVIQESRKLLLEAHGRAKTIPKELLATLISVIPENSATARPLYLPLSLSLLFFSPLAPPPSNRYPPYLISLYLAFFFIPVSTLPVQPAGSLSLCVSSLASPDLPPQSFFTAGRSSRSLSRTGSYPTRYTPPPPAIVFRCASSCNVKEA